MTVLLADDQPIALAGLQALLAPAGLRFQVADTPEQALRAVEDHLPRLVISGFFLTDGGRDAIPVIRELTTRWPELPVLVRAPHDDPHLRIGLSRLGARGLVATDTPLEVVMAAIERLLAGGTAFTPIPPGTLLLSEVTDNGVTGGWADGRMGGAEDERVR